MFNFGYLIQKSLILAPKFTTTLTSKCYYYGLRNYKLKQLL